MRPEFPEEFFESDSDIETTPEVDSTGEPSESLIYVGFNSQVVALSRETGRLVWEWKSPKDSGFVAVLLDGDRVIASVQGYTYCLDSQSGCCLWSNPLSGKGFGIPCLASSDSSTAAWSNLAQLAADQDAIRRRQHHQNINQHQIINQQHHS